MDHDILELVRQKQVIRIEDEVYSILTCRCCGFQEEFIGTMDTFSLSGGWYALSLGDRGPSKVLDWLLCPKCVNKVRLAAGLKVIAERDETDIVQDIPESSSQSYQRKNSTLMEKLSELFHRIFRSLKG